MKISLRKVTKLEVIGKKPTDLGNEITVTVKCWVMSVEKPVKQNLDDDDSEILRVEVLDGIARIT